MEAGDRDDGEEQEWLRVSHVAASNGWWNNDEGKMRHHIGLVDLHQRLCPLNGHNVLVDDIAFVRVVRGR